MTENELNAARALYQTLTRRINRLDHIEKTGGVRAASSGVKVQGGHGLAPAQEAAELRDEIVELEKKLEVERAVIGRYIDRLPLEEIERKLLISYYVKCKPWDLVAEEICYSTSRTYDFRAEAMKKVRSSSEFIGVAKSCQEE